MDENDLEETIDRETRIAERLLKQKEASFRSWVRDLFPLVLLAISGLVWGMKLESRYDKIEERQTTMSIRVAALEEVVSRGILPRTEERFSSTDRSLNNFDKRLEKLEQDCVPNNHSN